jgi:trans-L-3-hydroxyproline dehydratase
MAFDALQSWRPPIDWLRISTIDAHTGGEPLRIIVDGVPPIPGATILERRRYVRDHLDHLRTALMYEPRGHREMYGCLVMPPATPGAHFGVLFMHNEGYSTMCGHGVIAMAMVAVETGLVPATGGETEVRIDTPAGLVVSRVHAGTAPPRRVTFRIVPSFVLALDEVVEVPGLGWVKYDLAFGGAFYAYVDARSLGLALVKEDHARIIEVGMAIKHAVMRARAIDHPNEPDLGFLYGTILVGPARHDGAQSRNVCVFADGQVDRSPTGTGVSGRLAIHFARGEVREGETLVIESLVDSRFSGTVVGMTTVGRYAAVIPEVSGTAHVTGRHEFLIDPSDPLRDGFLLG